MKTMHPLVKLLGLTEEDHRILLLNNPEDTEDITSLAYKLFEQMEPQEAVLVATFLEYCAQEVKS